MNPILKRLKEWNDVFPEHMGYLQINLMDDGSGSITSPMYDDEEIFTFIKLADFFDAEPQKVKDGIR